MRLLPLKLLPIFALVALTAGCGGRGPGVVQGDAYLAEDIGREVNLAGLTVRLVEAGEKAELDSLLAREACPSRTGAAAPGAEAQARERAWRERARILGARTVRTVTSNRGAQFVFDSVPPGRYRLWADTVVDSTRWTWLQPLRVRGGDTIRTNLSNANPDENPFRC